MDVDIETRKQLSEAVHTGDIGRIRSVASRNPAAIREGWLGRATGASYLHLAARKGQTDTCAVLVDLGIDINRPCPDEGNGVPLGDAATGGHLATVRWLLKHGASVDALPTTVATPLMAASLEGHLDIARLLLDAGAEVNREHLRLPQTALDFAVFYQVKKTGQDAVAALLRERGGIRPYTEKHDWNGVPGQPYIEHVERAVGGFVNPLAASQFELGIGQAVTIRKVRIPKKYDYQLLFTVGLAASGFELALCLPSAWPLNQSSLQTAQYRWPIDLLVKLGIARVDGRRLGHGDLLNTDDPVLARVGVPEEVRQWIVGTNQIIEAEREGDSKIAQTLLLVPITTKRPLKSGLELSALADKKSKAKWEKIALDLI